MSWKQTRNFNRNQTDLAGMCHRFVRSGYGIPAVNGYYSAWSAWSKSPTKHTGRDFPTNVVVPIWFSHYGTYGSPAKYDNWGHVVVWYPGVGYISSPGSGTGQKIFSTISAVESYFRAKYVGWTEDVNGYRVIEKVTLKPDQRQVKPDSNVNVRSEPNTKAKILRALTKNGIYTLPGYVYGEDYGGSNLWYSTGDGYAWAGGFTQVSTAGLSDLNIPDPEITTEELTVTKVLPYVTERKLTNHLPLGNSKVIQKGVDGEHTQTFLITYEDGVEVKRELQEETISPAVNEIIEIGTHVNEDELEPEPTPEIPTLRYNWLTVLIPIAIAFIVGIFSKHKEPTMNKNLNPDAPSQVKYPGVTTARTVVQNLAGTILAIVLGFVTLTAVAPQILEALADVLPESAYAWLSGIVAGAVAISAAITRVMAIPAVNEWLKKIGLGVPPSED